MDGTTSSEAAEVQLLDSPLEIQHADRGSADTAALLGGGFFVAPDGAWLREGSDEFFVALGDRDPDYDAPLFAIKNLGFIVVRVVAGPLVNITLHPRNVASAALRSLQQWLLLFQFSSVKLNYLKDRWISEILTTRAQVICRLFEISALEMTEDASYSELLVACNITARQIGFSSMLTELAAGAMIPVTRRIAHQDGSDAGDDRECAAPLREPNLAPNDGPSMSAASISPSRGHCHGNDLRPKCGTR